MTRHPFLQLAAVAALALAAGCTTLSTPVPPGSVDLGGGLAMTPDGAILGALPLPPAGGDIDAEQRR